MVVIETDAVYLGALLLLLSTNLVHVNDGCYFRVQYVLATKLIILSEFSTPKEAFVNPVFLLLTHAKLYDLTRLGKYWKKRVHKEKEKENK